jgi:hypothetical protein
MALSGSSTAAPGEVPEVGCDVARYGDDWTEIHVRWGPASLSHEAANGWSTVRTAKRLMELARELAERCTRSRPPGTQPVSPKTVLIKVDDDGVGGGVLDILWNEGFAGVAVNAGSSPYRPSDYPNRRSELWFQTVEKARSGRLNLSRLSREDLERLEVQALAPTWKLDNLGRRQVEPKADTKKKLGRSPDGMDAVNLAFFESVWVPPPVIEREARKLDPGAAKEEPPVPRKRDGQGPTVTKHFGGYPNVILQDSDFPERPRRRPFHDR